MTEPLDAYPTGMELRREPDARTADPMWELGTGLPTYRSLEQREAVRAVMSSAPDATVLVLLPTGSGKSLVGLLQPLLDGEGSVSVVVVPTVSLAVDQEERLRERLESIAAPDRVERFAFHRGLDLGDRIEILQRVRDGRQRVVFTSPESLFGVLGEAVAEAAQRGSLAQLVVDEAHIVAGWGAEFRPDFQVLAGFRRELVSLAREAGRPFRTLLMTATASETDVEVLTQLFSEDGTLLTVCGAISLRPEVSYVACECDDEDERRQRVLEAIEHLPRPLFVYATTRGDVAALVTAIRESGAMRVVSVTGESNDVERREAIRALRGGEDTPPTADIAVGTSAFGLGIDVPDVRCVLHACLPEGIDRYYQEAGRGGRDGRASLSLLLWTESDIATARALSADRLIGRPLARERWSSMMSESTEDAGRVWLPIDSLRVGLLEPSDENRQWNARTLALMARSGAISLVGLRHDGKRELVGVRLLRGDLTSSGPWDVVDSVRKQSREAARLRLLRILEIARGGAVCDELRSEYEVDRPDLTTFPLVPDEACGGCAGCLVEGARPPVVPPLPIPPPVTHKPAVDGVLSDVLGGRPSLIVIDSGDPGWERRYARALAALVRAGIRNVVCDDELMELRAVRRQVRDLAVELRGQAPTITRPSELAYDGLELARFPTALLVGPTSPDGATRRLLERPDLLPTPVVAIVPAVMASSERSDMTVREMRPGAPNISSLVRALG